jgi:DNA-binding beta-propeller fold protein YncE
MILRRALSIGLAVTCAFTGDAHAQVKARTGGDYVFTGDIDLGGPGFWDYATLDGDSHRLYIGHVDKITVVDVSTRKVVGTVAPLSDAHGVAIVASLQKGYASSGGDGMLEVFDLGTLRVTKQIAVGEDADGVIFDPHARVVIVMVGGAKQVVVVDPATDSVTRTIDLPDVPEFAAADGRGNLYVNLVKTAQMAKVDIAAGRLDAVWPLDGCKAPHGLAYDAASDRLFSGCANRVMAVVDPQTGKNVATIPIGGYSDDVGLDAKRHRIFSPNGDGTLTVIRTDSKDKYSVERTIPTFLGGRSMAVDGATGELFVTHGDTRIKSPPGNPLELRFGWDNAEVATFVPND